MSKIIRAFEIFWLIMCLVGIGMCVYYAINRDNQNVYYFLAFSFVCGILYSLRRRQRKNLENSNK